MRSELPWSEPRSTWHRFGPTLLGLSIIGIGIGGAVRIVRAQDTISPIAVPAQAKPDAPAAPTPSDDARVSARQEDRAASKELDALLRQRSDLDARIADLRRRVRSLDRTPSGPRDKARSADPRGEIERNSDWRGFADDARQQARDAMQQAREAMREAMDAFREAQRSTERSGGDAKDPFNVPLPKLPTLPKFEFDFKGSLPDKFDSESMKRFQEQLQKIQPQLEQQMREFQKRMEEWQRSFEQQQRQKEKQLRDQQNRHAEPDVNGKSSADVHSDAATRTADTSDKASDSENDSEPL